MFYVYCLESEISEDLYFGYTKDLKRRLKEHNQKLNFSTKKYVPWRLIYYEAGLNEEDAKRREKYLKTSTGRRMFRRRIISYIKNKSKIYQSKNSLPGKNK